MKFILKLFLFSLITLSALYGQSVISQSGKTITLNKPADLEKAKNYQTIYRNINGVKQAVGIIRITKVEAAFIECELVKKYFPYSIRIGDKIDIEKSSNFNFFRPTNYRTISLSHSTEPKTHSDLRLDYSPWFMNWLTVSLRGILGNTKINFSDYLIGYSGGIGNTIQIGRININNLLYYNRIYDPDILRGKDKSQGDDLWSYHAGIDIKIFHSIYASMGYETYLKDNYKKHDIKKNHLTFSIKFNVNEVSSRLLDPPPHRRQ